MKRNDNFYGFIFGLTLVTIIGYTDYITGIEVTFTLFYLIPISLTWYIGVSYGLIIALSCSLCLIINEFLWNYHYLNQATPYWNTISRLVIFIGVTFLIASLKKQMLLLEKRVEEETGRRIEHERLLARQSRLAKMGEMIGAIAHQWRQPLSAILSSMQTIGMAWENNEINEKYIEDIETDIQKQIQYMSDTIDDFRNFFSHDKIIGAFEVCEKLRQVVSLLSDQFDRSDVEIKTGDSVAKMHIKTMGYQNEFKQAIFNILCNSFDAIIEKRVQQSCSDSGFANKGLISIDVNKLDNNIIITIADNGCGIQAKYVDRVFDPYFTSKSDGKGTGIGLYMTRLIIEESMGGKISFVTGVEGTIFRVMLPLENLLKAEENER